MQTKNVSLELIFVHFFIKKVQILKLIFYFLTDCSYPGSRFKDEVTEYYYGGENNRQQQQYTPAVKSPFQNHVHTLDDRYGRTYTTNNKGHIDMY